MDRRRNTRDGHGISSVIDLYDQSTVDQPVSGISAKRGPFSEFDSAVAWQAVFGSNLNVKLAEDLAGNEAVAHYPHLATEHVEPARRGRRLGRWRIYDLNLRRLHRNRRLCHRGAFDIALSDRIAHSRIWPIGNCFPPNASGRYIGITLFLPIMHIVGVINDEVFVTKRVWRVRRFLVLAFLFDYGSQPERPASCEVGVVDPL